MATCNWPVALTRSVCLDGSRIKSFEQLVLAIIRNMPLREPSVLTVKGLRRILQTSDGVSARIFRMLNEVAIEAIETGAERITDEAIERYKPVGEGEAAYQ
jgi:hypothetical protein